MKEIMTVAETLRWTLWSRMKSYMTLCTLAALETVMVLAVTKISTCITYLNTVNGDMVPLQLGPFLFINNFNSNTFYDYSSS